MEEDKNKLTNQKRKKNSVFKNSAEKQLENVRYYDTIINDNDDYKDNVRKKIDFGNNATFDQFQSNLAGTQNMVSNFNTIQHNQYNQGKKPFAQSLQRPNIQHLLHEPNNYVGGDMDNTVAEQDNATGQQYNAKDQGEWEYITTVKQKKRTVTRHILHNGKPEILMDPLGKKVSA